MTTLHTNGPWHVNDYHWVYDNQEQEIAKIVPRPNRHGNYTDSVLIARLIAAAPELLEALVELHFMTDPEVFGGSLDDARSLAAEVITKATGFTPEQL